MNGAQMVVKALELEGVRCVFGIPGGSVIPLYDALYDAPFPHILVRHEQAAAHAADGYARVTGEPGVCICTSGPGFTNILTGLATAFLDSVQLVGCLVDPDFDGDADGMPDLWEAQRFPEGVAAQPDEDSDFDGPSNYAECIAGTDPTSATSVLQLAPAETAVAAITNLIFRWPSATGRVYAILRATNAAGPYTQHVGNLSAIAPTNAYTNAAPTELGTYFYGIGVQRAP